jgi:rhamnose utilization protein RhaD (predicted bifunctional aldolase and dehydrogenase)
MKLPERNRRLKQLVELSRRIGTAPESFAILGEGNTSTRSGEDTFWVKASGTSLSTADKKSFTECRRADLAPLWENPNRIDAEVDAKLIESQVKLSDRKPSTEALFHSYLLSLPGIEWVAHTHPIAVNGILCSPKAADFAKFRMFPDEIVCGGEQSVLVPYTDPGVPLAKAIRHGVENFEKEQGRLPRMILLQNHGLIAIGPSAGAVEATTKMAEKSAKIFLGAASLGGPVFMPEAQVLRISGRPDELYRQKVLKLE